MAELERVQKAKSALELEREESCRNIRTLKNTLNYELLNCKAGLREAKVKCDMIFTLLEKKATEATVSDIPSNDIVHPPRVKRAKKKKNTRRGHKSN